MAVSESSHLALTFGLLGNIVSFLVYLAPVPTFYRICKKKSTEGFQAIPYSVALFSAMLYLYYAFLKESDGTLLMTINGVGFFVEVLYLTIFMIFATKESRVFTAKLLVLFNVSSLGLIVACTYFLANGLKRVHIVGWICAAFSLSVFAAPLSIMRQVIRTKSVEFMPLAISFFLTICAVVWFFYGFLIKDYYIAAPNILGFAFGVAQMILYAVYKNHKQMLPEASRIHNCPSGTIIVDLKVLDQSRDSSENEPAGKHEVEIIVLDCEEQVPGDVVVQSN